LLYYDNSLMGKLICILGLKRLLSNEEHLLEWSVDAERVGHVLSNLTLYGLAPQKDIRSNIVQLQVEHLCMYD
jgi:hypothetical protein